MNRIGKISMINSNRNTEIAINPSLHIYIWSEIIFLKDFNQNNHRAAWISNLGKWRRDTSFLTTFSSNSNSYIRIAIWFHLLTNIRSSSTTSTYSQPEKHSSSHKPFTGWSIFRWEEGSMRLLVWKMGLFRWWRWQMRAWSSNNWRSSSWDARMRSMDHIMS